MRVMKIGIFDSGLGGLIIARAIQRAMPMYDYVYLGDTKRVPYGNRSHDTVYQFTKEAVEYLVKREKCALVLLACNTASARALKKLQKEYEGRAKVLGVLVPTAEIASNFKSVGVLATRGTVASNTFVKEIKKTNSHTKVFQNPAPMLVPLAEEGESKLALPFLLKYLKPLMGDGAEAIVLGCTHYPIFKKEFRKILGNNAKLISQDEIVPEKLKGYLSRHLEVSKKLSKKRTIKILVTDKTQNVELLTKKWFGKSAKPSLIKI
jgi:glutamate racemase